jgi:flagellar basal body-associated protein FliL
MQKVLTRIFLITALAAVSVWALPVLAAEEEGASGPKSEKAESGEKSAKDEGGEEGGKKKKKGDEDVSGGRFAGDPVYVHITPLVLPVISAQGVEQLVTVIIDVEVKDFDTADNMHTNMPRVKDALMRALYGGLGQGSLRNGKLVDVNKVKVRATAALNEVIGEGGIREVLIQGIAQRML